MAGAKTDPAVFLPRYSTFGGVGVFTTSPINIVDYYAADVYSWRGKIPTGTTFSVVFEESVDLETWTVLGGGDPGQDTEAVLSLSLNRAWLRAKLTLATSSAYPVATCYAIANLVRRS